MNKAERNHCLKMVYSLWKLIKELAGLIVLSMVFVKKIGIMLSIVLVVLLLIVLIIIEILMWWKNSFIMNESSIYHQEGLLNIKKTDILFERINTVDISQDVLQRIFNVATVKIDTGYAKEKSELKIMLNKDRALEIKMKLLNNVTTESMEMAEEKEHFQENNNYTICKKDLFIYSIISDSALKGLALLFVVYNFFDRYLNKVINIDTSRYAKNFESGNYYYKIYLLVGLFFIIMIISVCLSLGYNILKYYNFKMVAEEKKIDLSYGAISTKNYSFTRKKIKGIYIKQTLLMQFFGYFTLEIESIGYGNENGEKSILYPICNKNTKDDIVAKLFKEFQYKGAKNHPPKNAYFGFFYKKIIFGIIVTTICFFIKIKILFVFCFIMFVLLLIIGCLEFKNTFFGMDENLVYICGGSFNKVESIMKMKTIQSVKMSYSYFQYKKGICNYNIMLYSATFGKELKIRNISDRVTEKDFR